MTATGSCLRRLSGMLLVIGLSMAVVALRAEEAGTVHERHAAHAHAGGHAPIGVIGDHRHGAGEWMFSYRYMRMEMRGTRDGRERLSPEDIVARFPNRFAGQPMQPETLRVVPTAMTMDMHMLGLMYAPSDRVTLMAMSHYVRNTMDHVTFAGPNGSDRLGTFTSRSEGLGDISVTALVGLAERGAHQLHLNAGLSLPTGSITERDDVLTPANTRPALRLPYTMQLGSGTVDAVAGLTYLGRAGSWSWGAQGGVTLRTGRNDEGYALGDRFDLTGWMAYDWSNSVSTSFRLSSWTEGSIDGLDTRIAAPVQTANPDHYGGFGFEAAAGLNYQFARGVLAGHRIAFEWRQPFHQHLSGPQLESDGTLTVGWQRAF